jgi:HemY protein
MKRGLLLALMLLSLGGLLGLWLLRDPGYVLLSWHLQSIEMSLWLAAAAWLVSLLAAMLVIELLLRLLDINGWWSRWRRRRYLERSANAMEEGCIALEQGDWRRAERLLFSAARLSPRPLPAYLAAARAAARGQDFERAEQYLVLAEERGNKLAVGLARVRLQLASGRWEQAAASLRRLQDRFRKDNQTLALRVEALTRLQKWGELADILPLLQKRDMNDANLAALEKHAHREVLDWMAQTSGRVDRGHASSQLQKYWASLPRRLRHDEDLFAAYANELLKVGADDEAEALLADNLSRQWSNAAVEVYGRTRSTRPDQALARAEGWHAAHAYNPALLLTLGRLSLQNRHWPEARRYFESALELHKSPETYAELIRLLARLDKPEAVRLMTESAAQSDLHLPDLPLP